ncbi:MAG: HAMP domain-containing protein [Verrucomicrobiales bacterium]|nr:HAMP domain-containing protein [Verrucomicrobiales bacterium]
MRSGSFRNRITLWSVLISGTVLLCFGLVAWWSLNRDRISNLDESLATFGFRHAIRASANADPVKMELSLLENFGEETTKTRFFALLTRGGEELHRSAGWPDSISAQQYPPSDLLLDPQPLALKQTREDRGEKGPRPKPVYAPVFHTVRKEKDDFRIGVFANKEVILVVGADLRELSGEVDALRRAFLLSLPGALLLIAGGSWIIARRALRPVDALEREMRNISADALDRRLTSRQVDLEFARIIDQYNAMLDRLERSFHQATRFSADASHELKTPLAVMRGTLERALADSGDDSTAQAVYSDLLEQTDRQKSILEGLLLLSRADAGNLQLSSEAIDLSEKLNLWLEDASYLAEDRDITIQSEIAPGLLISGDPVLLQQVALNLFSNAVRHNHDGGELICRLFDEGNFAHWEITNSGPLLPESEQEKVFDRFQRASTAQGSGSGLGLSLVREIISVHGGTVGLRAEQGKMVCRVKIPKISLL